MTSLAETYLACKAAFAAQLTNKGVTASSSDGLSTLIGKIEDIEQGTCTNGIFLYAAKDICQTSDTVGVGAVAVSNGKLVDDTITVYKSDTIYQNKMTSSASEWLVIDEDYDGLTVTSNGATLDASTGETTTNDVYLNRSLDIKNDSHIIEFDCKPLSGSSACVSGQIFYKVGGDGYYENFWIMSSGGTLCDDSFSLPSGYTFGDWTHVRMEWTPTEQKIYIDGTLADTTTQDYSSASGYDDLYLTLRCSGSGYGFIVKNVSVLTNPASVCSGSHGSATGTYTGAGRGKIEMVAVCGSVQSEPYRLLDCIFEDKGTPYKDSSWTWTNSSSAMSVTSDENGTMMKSLGAGITPRIYLDNTITDFVAEFDFKYVGNGYVYLTTYPLMVAQSTSATGRTQLTENTWYRIKIEFTNSTSKIYVLENNTWVLKTTLAVSTSSGKFGFGSYQGSTFVNKETWFKNLAIYPI